MLLFFLDFVIKFLISVFLIWIIATSIKEKKSIKKYILISLISIIAFLHIWLLFIPKAMDISQLLQNGYKVQLGLISKVNKMNFTFNIGNDKFYFNPWKHKINLNRYYKVKYLPKSKYAIEIEPIK